MGLSLGAHSAVVGAYGIGIESANSYSFLMEPVLHGDLITLIQPKVGPQIPSGPPGAFLGLTALSNLASGIALARCLTGP